MKTLFALVALLFSIKQVGFGQTYFGVKGGTSLANINQDENYIIDFTNYKSKHNRIGYHFGMFGQRDISKRVFLRTELVYAVKGYRMKQYSSDQKLTIGLNYLSLPLLVGLRLKNNFSAFLGPEFSSLGPVYASSRSIKERHRLDAIVNYEHFDAGLTIGTLYTITPKFNLDLRYTYGFSKILIMDVTDNQGNFLYQTSQKNSKALQLSLNYYFRAKV